MILTGKEREEEATLIMMGNWPHFPVLPVKRNRADGGWPDFGIIFWVYEIEKTTVKVYLANLYELNDRARAFRQEHNRTPTYAEILEGVETREYASLDSFFDDGWRAD